MKTITQRSNFSTNDLSSSRVETNIYSNADGTPAPTSLTNLTSQISDIQAKIQKVNETVDANKKQLEYINPRIAQVGTRTYPPKGYRGWIDGAGVFWTNAEADAANKDATLKKAGYDAYNATAPKLLAGYVEQLESLKKTLDSLSKTDPTVIAANAQAQAAISAATSKSNTMKYIVAGGVGLVLLITIGAIIIKIKNAKK